MGTLQQGALSRIESYAVSGYLQANDGPQLILGTGTAM